MAPQPLDERRRPAAVLPPLVLNPRRNTCSHTESHHRDARVVDQRVRERRQQPAHEFFFVGIGRLPHRLRHLLFDAFGDLAQQRHIAIFLAVKQVVERLIADVGGLADLLDRRVGIPVAGEQLERRRQELFTTLRAALVGVQAADPALPSLRRRAAAPVLEAAAGTLINLVDLIPGL